MKESPETRIFKNAWFERFARQNKLTDQELREAVTRAEKGLIDADLGGGVIKQRIARQGQGKSGGYRSIIIFRSADKAFFVYGFAKNKRDNISKDEEKAFKKAAKALLGLSDEQLTELTSKKDMTEVM